MRSFLQFCHINHILEHNRKDLIDDHRSIRLKLNINQLNGQVANSVVLLESQVEVFARFPNYLCENEENNLRIRIERTLS